MVIVVPAIHWEADSQSGEILQAVHRAEKQLAILIG